MTRAKTSAAVRIGDQVMLPYANRVLLGDVRAIGRFGRLVVRHFNGELWPVRPLARDVRVLRA